MLYDDFPNNIIEFEEMFSTEEACRNHLFKFKYPSGFKCPKCDYNRFWWTDKDLMHCSKCGHQASLKKGTIMEGSKKPIKFWYRAIYLVSFQKIGISAKNLQRQLGFGSYQTAWSWLQKIRLCMRRAGREALQGEIEVDESYYGGKFEGKRGRGSENKSVLALGVEKEGSWNIGRIRIEMIPDASSGSLNEFIKTNIEIGSTIRTDNWTGYNCIPENYGHITVDKNDEDAFLSSIHLVISLYKRWTMGVHQGAVSDKHLQKYLDEFVFRFNRRKSKSRGKVFYRLIEQAIYYKATPYWNILGRVNPNTPLEKAA